MQASSVSTTKGIAELPKKKRYDPPNNYSN
jgi:hypothetical protein